MPAPLVSIILVCRNPGLPVREALESIWAQTGPDHEIIVIDGASTDGTREWLEQQTARIGALVSESDNGIYDAMNKGIAAARGDWVFFLGSDDRLLNGALIRNTPTLQQTDADVVVGEAAYDDSRIYRLGESRTAIRRNFVHHQAAFYRSTLFALHGGFQTGLRIMADYEFNLRLLRAGAHFQPVTTRIAACGIGGLSDAGTWTGYREEISVRHRYFPAWRCWLWDLLSMVRFLRKKFVLRMTRQHG